MAIKISGTTVIDDSRVLTNLGSPITIAQGGTGATDAAGALTALGAYPASNPNGYTTNVGDVTLTGTQTLTNKTLTSPVLNTATASGLVLNDGYTEEVFAVTGTTPTLSPTNGSIQTWTLSASSTPTAGTWAEGQSITLMIDDGTAYAITWTSLPVTWKTNGGVAPTLLTSGFTPIILYKVGTTIYGARVGDA